MNTKTIEQIWSRACPYIQRSDELKVFIAVREIEGENRLGRIIMNVRKELAGLVTNEKIG